MSEVSTMSACHLTAPWHSCMYLILELDSWKSILEARLGRECPYTSFTEITSYCKMWALLWKILRGPLQKLSNVLTWNMYSHNTWCCHLIILEIICSLWFEIVMISFNRCIGIHNKRAKFGPSHSFTTATLPSTKQFVWCICGWSFWWNS